MYEPRKALIAGFASLATVTVLIIIKTAAFIMSGSASILASLTDSVVDAGVSLMSLLAIKISLLPADKNHRYGHGKVEGLAALLQAVFMASAAVFLALEAIDRFQNPQPVTDHVFGIVVMVIAIVFSVALVMLQKRMLDYAPSLAVEADKVHYSSDILINGGVIVALGIQMAGGPGWVDPVFALIVSGWLVFITRDVARKGIDMLLDRELPKESRERIKIIIHSDPRIHDAHDLRTRTSGMKIHISFDIEVDDTLTIKQAHEIAIDAENRLLAEFPNAEIMIHIDPMGDTHDARHEVIGVHH